MSKRVDIKAILADPEQREKLAAGPVTGHRQSRCRTCSVVYVYQASGFGCQEDLNSHEWCPDCRRVYLEAFKDVPARVKKVWLPTTDFTCQELLDAHGLLAGLGIIPMIIEGKSYRWSWWTGEGIESGEVLIESEHDVATGATRPWRKIT